MDPCFQCGTCSATCPLAAGDGAEPYSARRLLRVAQLGLPDDDGLFRCVACRQCETRCPRGVNIVESVMGLRSLAFEERRSPPEDHKLLWSTLEEGNPWSAPRAERAKWSEGLNLRDAKQGVRVLLYAGCAVSYDPRLMRVARGLASAMTTAGVDVGILGPKERCCGDAARSTGERAYLERLVMDNVKAMRETGAQTIVAVSPHCYDIFRNLYPRYGLEAEVLHATQYLERLLDEDKLPKPARVEGRVAYHDPCFLGRHNGVYEAPRKLLEHVPGLELVELKDTRANALCCGGGGGGMWRNDPARLADRRYMQAKDADLSLVATSCPYCIQNFEDAGKRFGGPRVRDVTELLFPTGGSA